MFVYDADNENIINFIQHVKSECKKHGVKLDIRATSYIWCDGSRVSGFFQDGDNPVLRLAGKHSLALQIFAHEYSHMTQWLDKDSIWYTSTKDHNKLAQWLSGKRTNHINTIITEIRDLELDNEKRTVKIIKKFNLPIDPKRYTKEANSYIFFHEHMRTSRRWCKPKNSPYKNKRLTDAMPDRFVKDYTKYFEKVRHIYEEENI